MTTHELGEPTVGATGTSGSDDPSPPASLTATAVRGIRLAGLGYATSQILNLLAYLVLVRLLTPRAFGLYAAGTVITGIGGLFAESGMLAALIKREDRLDEAASTAFVSLAISGVALTLLSLALSPLIGLAFHSGQVRDVTAVLSGWLFIRALTIVPDALLQRGFSFLRRVIVDPLGTLAYAAAAIPLAAAGAGVWAMVGGAYASIIVQAIGAWIASRFRPRWRLMSVGMWRELSGFARPLVAGEILRRVMLQVDVFVLGRFTNAATLGQYRNGQMLAWQPSGMFGQVVAYVILPVFSRLSVVPARIEAAARHAYWSAYALVVPLSLCLLPLGVPIAVTVLGDRWRGAGHALAALSGSLLGFMLMSISGELMKAIGALGLQLRIQAIGLALTVVTVAPAGIEWGLVGVAIAVSVSACVTVLCAMVGIARRLDVPVRRLFDGAPETLSASLAMIAAMMLFDRGARVLAHPEGLRVALLAAEITIGAAVYAAVISVDPRRRAAGMRALAALRMRAFNRAR
ncbi:MAG: oligosaccharide flippase family protein [Solirubrobacteraceae bacterium]